MPSSDLVQKTRSAEMAREPLAKKLYAEGTAFSLALADRIGVDRFVRAAVTSFKTTPKLADCDWDTVLGGLYLAAQLGLEVGGPRGLAYLVPYGSQAALVLGYKGWVDLMYRAGARSVQWFLVREGDQFRIGSDAVHGMVYEWHPAGLDDGRPWTGAVAQVMLANGGIVWDYMTKEAILARRPSKWKGTPWEKWETEMALKTVLKHLSKRVPLSTEVALAVEGDDTIRRRVHGLEQPIVEHVPVAGLPAGQQGQGEEPRGRTKPLDVDAHQARQDAAREREEPREAPAGPSGPPEPPQAASAAPEEDEEAAYLRREQEDHAAWLASQGDPS